MVIATIVRMAIAFVLIGYAHHGSRWALTTILIFMLIGHEVTAWTLRKFARTLTIFNNVAKELVARFPGGLSS